MTKMLFKVLCLVFGVENIVTGVVGVGNCSKKCISGAPPASSEAHPEMATFLPGVDEIYNEEPCALQGGMCVIQSDCMADKMSKIPGLCPAQRASKNVECCFGVSIKETRCTKYGGQCVSVNSGCGRVVDRTKIKDCAPAEICCILS